MFFLSFLESTRESNNFYSKNTVMFGLHILSLYMDIPTLYCLLIITLDLLGCIPFILNLMSLVALLNSNAWLTIFSLTKSRNYKVMVGVNTSLINSNHSSLRMAFSIIWLFHIHQAKMECQNKNIDIGENWTVPPSPIKYEHSILGECIPNYYPFDKQTTHTSSQTHITLLQVIKKRSWLSKPSSVLMCLLSSP